jgi:hypothetical protein
VLATAMGRPLPRWADEGAALLAEDIDDTEKLKQGVRQVLGKKDRVPLRRLFAVREYNEMTDVNLLFAEGYSVARFLVERVDKPTFLAFVKKGMDEGWDAAAKSCYRFNNVELMEAAWLEWLRVREIKPTNEARPAKAEDFAFPIPHTVVRPPAPPLTPAPQVSLAPKIATAWVDEDGKLAVRYHGGEFVPITSYRRDENGSTMPVTSLAPAGQDALRRYRLLDVRGFHLKKASLEEIELRTLAAHLRHEVPVVVTTASRAAEGPRSFEKLFFSVIKDDTIVLYLPSGDQLSPRPPAPPPSVAPTTPPVQRH